MRTPGNIFRYLRGLADGSARSREQPSLAFQRAAGLNGIAASYRFPEGRSAAAFDHWAGSFCSCQDGDGFLQKRYLQKTWDKLVTLNPELAIVEHDRNPQWLREGIFGAASQYNPDDLDFFIGLKKRIKSEVIGLSANRVPEYRELCDKIERKSLIDIRWVASPRTLLRIYDQVKDRQDLRADVGYSGIMPRGKNLTPAQIATARDYIIPILAHGALAL